MSLSLCIINLFIIKQGVRQVYYNNFVTPPPLIIIISSLKIIYISYYLLFIIDAIVMYCIFALFICS